MLAIWRDGWRGKEVEVGDKVDGLDQHFDC